MNPTKNLMSLIAMVLFAIIAVMEVVKNDAGLTSAGLIVAVIMLILTVICRFMLVTKYKEGNRETMQAATDALKNVSLPMGFLGGVTLPLSIVFTAAVVIQALSGVAALPAPIISAINAVVYVMICLLPLAFAMGLLNGKYGGGMDFMVYSVGLIVCIAANYFLNKLINPFACSQLVLSLALWDMVSGLMRKTAPAPKAPKEKKPKVKREKKSKEAKAVDAANDAIVAKVAAETEKTA